MQACDCHQNTATADPRAGRVLVQALRAVHGRVAGHERPEQHPGLEHVLCARCDSGDAVLQAITGRRCTPSRAEHGLPAPGTTRSRMTAAGPSASRSGRRGTTSRRQRAERARAVLVTPRTPTCGTRWPTTPRRASTRDRHGQGLRRQRRGLAGMAVGPNRCRIRRRSRSARRR